MLLFGVCTHARTHARTHAGRQAFIRHALVCMRFYNLRDLFPGTGRTYATHGDFFRDGQAGRPGKRAISGFVPGRPSGFPGSEKNKKT